MLEKGEWRSRMNLFKNILGLIMLGIAFMVAIIGIAISSIFDFIKNL